MSFVVSELKKSRTTDVVYCEQNTKSLVKGAMQRMIDSPTLDPEHHCLSFDNNKRFNKLCCTKTQRQQLKVAVIIVLISDCDDVDPLTASATSISYSFLRVHKVF